MIDWDDNLVKLIIYVLYGTIFIAMATVLTLWRKKITQIEFMNYFGSLAIFAVLHGLAKYAEIPRFLNWQPLWVFDIFELILVSSSFAALLSFGLNVATAGVEENRWIRGIPHGALLMYFWFLAFLGADIASDTGINYYVAELAQRHSLGFLGAIVTSYAFFELSQKINVIAGEKAGKKIHTYRCFLCFLCSIRWVGNKSYTEFSRNCFQLYYCNTINNFYHQHIRAI